jgi:hypothetical protein
MEHIAAQVQMQNNQYVNNQRMAQFVQFAQQGGAPPPGLAGPGAPGQHGMPSVVSNQNLSQAWGDYAGAPDYKQLFGSASYVKNGSDPQLLSMLQAALQKAPELRGSSLEAHVQAGKVGPDDMKELQQFLESKGLSVGSTGVDGKYGPNTHGALQSFLNQG